MSIHPCFVTIYAMELAFLFFLFMKLLYLDLAIRYSYCLFFHLFLLLKSFKSSSVNILGIYALYGYGSGGADIYFAFAL